MTDSQETIKQMIKMIEQEAKEKADSILEDAKQRSTIERNKIYKEEIDKLNKEYKRKEEQDAQNRKT
jgi:C4-type Zn-finger protein